MKLNQDRRRAKAPALALEHFLPYRLSVLTNTISAKIAGEYGDRFGLSIPEWRTLAVLGRFAPLTASGVVARTAMDKVRVSRAVARLLEGGMLDRAVDPEDRRRAPLRLSRKGRRVYEQIVPLAVRRETELLACLDPEEKRQLDALLDRLQVQAERMGG